MLNREMGKRINIIRQKLKMDQWSFAKKLNMQPKSIIEWEKGNYAPTVDEINNIYKVFGVPNSYILDGYPDNILPIDKDNQIKIPIMNNDLNANKIEGYIDTLKDDLPDGKLFWFKCIDDSMEPKIEENDYVLVHQQDNADNDDIVIAETDDTFNIYNLKTLCEHNAFIPENMSEQHPPITTSIQDIRIVGKVIQSMGYF